jgi:O-antigen ligase
MYITEAEPILTGKLKTLLLLPVFILILACTLSIGKLLVLAVAMRIFLCWRYKRSYSKRIFNGKLFKYSVFFIAMYLLFLLIPTVIMHGDMGEIGHYAERILPFFLLLFVADEETNIWNTVWAGIGVSLLIICAETLPYALAGQAPLRGNFGWHNTLGGILAIFLPIFYFGVYKRIENHMLVGCSWLLIAVTLILMALTESRGALLGLFSSVVVFLGAIALKKNWKIKKICSMIIIAVVLVGSFVITTTFMGLNLNRNIAKDGRVALIEASWHMFLEHPLLGVGLGNWREQYDTVYGVNNIEKHIDSPHNIFLQELNEAGIIGLSGFLALLGFQYQHLLKSARADINANITKLQWPFAILLTYVVTLVHGQVDYIFFQRSYQMLYWLLWGVYCWSVTYEQRFRQCSFLKIK